MVRDQEKQRSLFQSPDPERAEKERRLMAAADALNLHYGRGTVRLATMGFAQRWQMRRERLSPCYTTRLSDLPVAKLWLQSSGNLGGRCGQGVGGRA